MTGPAAVGAPITGDTVDGNLTVNGWARFAGGIDVGGNGELLANWIPADASNPTGTAAIDIVLSKGVFLWRDCITPAPAARNKMKLDSSNAMTLYKADGSEGLVLDPGNGKITVLTPGTGSGIYFGSTTVPTLTASDKGWAVFPSQVTAQAGLCLTGGSLQINSTSPATSSAAGALTVAGGIGVGMDSYFNGVRIGRGAGNLTSNTVVGAGALNSNTTGYNNTASGTFALYSNTAGYCNTAFGPYALYANTGGSYNTASGFHAMRSNTTGYSNTASGSYSLYANTTGYSNTATGMYSLCANIMGYSNTAYGSYSLNSNIKGYCNTAAGTHALYANTSGCGNTAVGNQAAYPNTFGRDNVAVGNCAAYYQANGSTALTDPDGSIYIGAYVRGKDNNDNNSIVIGTKAVGEGANTTVIGNSSTTRTHLYGELVADAATVGGYAVLATRSGNNAQLANSAMLALGNGAGATEQAAIAIGQFAQAGMYSALALGDSACALGLNATAIQQAAATGTHAFAANQGCALGDYSLAVAGGQAYGAASLALGGHDVITWEPNFAMGTGSVALGGRMNVAVGALSCAMGNSVTASSAYSFAIGSQNLSRGGSSPSAEVPWWRGGPDSSDDRTWIEESPLLEVGNGNPNAAGFETSNAITTLKNGQTTLTNKAWKAGSSGPLADPEPTTDSEGNALVVEGHTVLKGRVMIEQPQGDISMGIYGSK